MPTDTLEPVGDLPLTRRQLERSLRDLAARSRLGAFYYGLLSLAVVAGTSVGHDHPDGGLGFVFLQASVGMLRYMLASKLNAGLVTDLERWRRQFIAGVCLTAGTMGIAGAWCVSCLEDPYSLALVLVAASGMSAAASLALAPSKTAQRLFMALLLTPMAVAALFRHLPGLSALIALYLIVSALLARVAAAWYADALRDNELLSAQTEKLRQATQAAEEVAERLSVANERLNQEIHERQQQAEELRRITQLNGSLLDAAGEGIMGLDAGGQILFANPRAAQALGRRVDSLKGQPVHSLLHATSGNCQPPCPEQATLLGAGVNMVKFYRPDRSSFPAEVVCSAMTGQSGNVIIFRDVAERVAVDRMKDEFVSVVSHELRTPLTAIKAPLGLLASGYLGTLSDKGKRMMEVAVANAERLIRLVNDILDYERLESGKDLLELEPVEINQLLAQAEMVVSPLLAQAEVTLLQIAEPGTIVVDASRIVQVLTNLIGNAIKFSPPGAAIGLNVRLTPEAVTFEVADQGRGIPPEQLERIFERFHQVNASDARDRGGTGLGLAITRSIVQRHNGRVWVESTVERGSSFFFSLPVVPRVVPPVPDPCAYRGFHLMLHPRLGTCETVTGPPDNT